MKALGVGLAAGEDVLKDWTGGFGRWSMSAQDIDVGFVAMLAVEGRDCRLAVFRYQPTGMPEVD